MSTNEPVVLVIVGPTAVGKTQLVHVLAKQIEGEIISADSRALYKWMRIGTDTPPQSFQREVRYHLINFLHPSRRYSAAQFAKDVHRLVGNITDRDHLPLITGGSRLYIKALTEGIFEGPQAAPDLREQLSQHSSSELHKELQEVDPASAKQIHPNDKKRIIRALEVYRLTGNTISTLKQEAEALPFDFRLIGLLRSRSEIYSRIDRRVEEMIEKGLVKEVQGLLDRGFSPDWGAWNTIGYKEVIPYLQGELSLEEAKKNIQNNTHQLARDQLNWIRSDDEVKTINLSECSEEEGIEFIKSCLD